ncbi:PRC-barrel domain-containing protein [Alkalihalobacillus sp. MEB130]|uniref:PRC-barrel domain-containing protein n=1 Tax=Alkalihalobacillus sp. MEB130 TaxID=2976704 RepID=UPI0028DD7DBB|nr:PRC-barrel domain-containing protein [Alkalihalobacillus sp. MEB130]MDT8861515.1 PRC-barrel domain-containing protein [Alkalihalobacillus sp. MEB130]
MRTFSTVEGLPVLSISTGKECGHVVDLCYENGLVTGFLIDPKGWFAKHLFLPVNHITSIGPDGVMVKDYYALQPLSKKEKHAFHLKHGKHRLHGTALLTAEGEKLGLLEDVYFLEEVGTIVGYEVTEGLVADLVEGRRVVKSDSKLTIAGGRAILTE